jgi:hypothetical protein
VPNRPSNRAPENSVRSRSWLAVILFASLALAACAEASSADPLPIGPLAQIAFPAAAPIEYLPFVTPTLSGIPAPRVGRRVGLTARSLKLVPDTGARIEIRCRGCPKRSSLTHGIQNPHAIHGRFIPNNATLVIILTASRKGGRYILRTHAGSASPATEELCLAPGSRTHPYKCEEPLPLPPPPHETNTSPVSLMPPQISGRAIAGETLSCSTGSWSASPTPAYGYQWTREHVPIAGADTATYRIPPADEGHTLYCEVTATNLAGSASTGSVGVTIAATPANTSPPQVTGTVRAGEALACSPGSWSGTPTPNLTYQWLREEVPIPGATQPTYRIQTADEGHQLACQVKAANSAGNAAAVSVPVLVPSLPIEYVLPQITGNPVLGETLACSTGSWAGTPSPTFTYQWLREAVPIPGTTQSTYRVSAADEGRQLACEVTARNSAGASVAISQAVSVPSAPANTGLPQITGSPAVGQSLSCSNGSWLGSSPITYTRQWSRDSETITGATSVQYTVQGADEGHELACWVTAHNPAGQAAAQTPALAIPEESGKPTITSVDGTRGDLAPYQGAFNIANQRFTARSNTITIVVATIANPSLPPGPTSYPAQLRVCKNEECTGPGAQLASVQANVENYGLTRAKLEAAVTPGETYYLVWTPPTQHEPTPWITFWHAGGASIAQSQEMEAAVRGYNKGSGGAHGEVISYLGTRAPPAPYSGPFEYAYQDFKAASNRINKLGVVVGNPRQARSAVGPHTIKVRLCETPDCSRGILATSEPFIANYEITEAQLSPAVKVTPGKTYFVNWQAPTPISGEPWVTFWLGTGPRPEESNAMQAFAKGYDAEGLKYIPSYLTEQVEAFGAPTFKSYLNASGEGPRIEAGASVEVSCRVYAPEIESTEPEGFWYRIHTAQWNDEYYAVANAFFNTREGEPRYTDTRVPEC